MTTETETPRLPEPETREAPKGSDAKPSPEYEAARAPLPGKTFTDTNGNTRTDN